MYYKLQTARNPFGNLIYPIDIGKLAGLKYRKDLEECVCWSDDVCSGRNGVTEITEDEYRIYPDCQISVDRNEFSADGTSEVIVTVNLPYCSDAKEDVVKLYDGETCIDFADAVTGQAQFVLKATEPRVFELTAESRLFGRSSEELVKAV